MQVVKQQPRTSRPELRAGAVARPKEGLPLAGPRLTGDGGPVARWAGSIGTSGTLAARGAITIW